MTADQTGEEPKTNARKRRLRAALFADVANFSGSVSVNETIAFGNLSAILSLGREALRRFEGDLITTPGDGLFALFESVVNSVMCALWLQEQLASRPDHGSMRLRIGIHVGDVLFDGDMPLGETINIASRLQSLADPGGILVSSLVVECVSARISVSFEDRGVPRLKNIPRQIHTYSVLPKAVAKTDDTGAGSNPLDQTMHLSKRELMSLLEGTDPGLGLPTSPPEPSTTEPSTSGRATPAPGPVTDQRPRIRVAAGGRPGDPAGGVQISSRQHSDNPADADLAARLAAPPSPEFLAVLAEVASRHLGPVGRVLIGQASKKTTTAGELIIFMEQQLTAMPERADFRDEAIGLLRS